MAVRWVCGDGGDGDNERGAERWMRERACEGERVRTTTRERIGSLQANTS